MKQVAVVLAGLGWLAAAGLAVGWLAASTQTAPAPAIPEPTATAGTSPAADDTVLSRLDAIETRLDRLAASMDRARSQSADWQASFEAAVTSAYKARASAPAAADPARAAKGADAKPGDPGAKGANSGGGKQGEKDPFAAKSNADLRLEARALAKDGKDVKGAIERLKALLARSLTGAERGDALQQLGHLYLEAGDLDLAAAAFAEAKPYVAGTPAAADPEVGLMWIFERRSDWRGVLDHAKLVIDCREANSAQRADALMKSGRAHESLGETDEARRTYESLKNGYAADPMEWARNMAQQATRRLDSLQSR